MSRPDWNSSELALAIACCRWPHDAARERAVRAAAAAGIDWERLLRVARRQRVEALVADGLKRSGIAAPAAIAAALDEALARTARDALRHAAVAVKLKAAFDAAGLPLLFIKGISLSMLAYGSLSLKAARDIDLLVTPEDEAAAEALLRGAGYRLIDPDPALPPSAQALFRRVEKETVWRHDGLGITVDLHRRLVNYRGLLPGLSALSPSQKVSLPGGTELPTLARPELFAYLAAHGALSGWSRLKWIADVAALLAAEPPEAIADLHRRSLALGAGRCGGVALLLCARLFGTPVPPDLLARLRRHRHLLRLEQVALHSMGGAFADMEVGAQRRGGRRILFSFFLLHRNWRYRLDVLRWHTISFEDRQRLKLPRPLHFLYPLLRLPLAWERKLRPAARA